MATATYKYPGNVIPITASAAVAPGDILVAAGRTVVAASAAKSGEIVNAHLVGVFTMPKKTSLSISQGDAVYWNATNSYVTKTNTDTPCGFAYEAADSDATEVVVKIG